VNLAICTTIITVLGAGTVFAEVSTMIDRIDDRDIAYAVEAELLVDTAVPQKQVGVKVENGIVTLRGSVENLLAKDRAVGLTETIRGVHGIIDELTVTPDVELTDNELLNRVKTALALDPATEDCHIRVSSQSRIVALSGEVDSHQEKAISEMVAKGVQGVEAIRNNLVVTHRPRMDDDIEADVVHRWDADPWIDESLLGVIVDQGRVSITGTVGSLDEKRRAIQYAWVDGVTGVEATTLSVQGWAHNPMRRSLGDRQRSDEQITQAVKLALRYDPRVKNTPIEVSTSDRIVTLSGMVPSLDAKRAAESDAENTTGVQRVLNRLEVLLITHPPYPEIQRNVKRALLEDPFLKDTMIRVRSEGETVWLSGTVHSLFDKVRAETVTARTAGVLAVENNLSSLSPLMADRDGVILKRIEERIHRSPYLFGKNIVVGVEDGIATLTGGVYSLAEWNLATQKAYEGGALTVRNRLSLTETESTKILDNQQ